MSAGTRVAYAEAKLVADELVELLGDTCQRLEIAGSIRRQERSVGDIELVVIPKTTRATVEDMFGLCVGYENLSQFDERCAELVEDGTFSLRPKKNGTTAWGPKAKFGIFREVAIDLYSVPPDAWGVVLLLRTGPWEFSKRMVTDRRHGGLCPSDLQFAHSRLCHRRTGEPYATPDEDDVFSAMGYGFVRPEARLPTTTPPRLGGIRR